MTFLDMKSNFTMLCKKYGITSHDDLMSFMRRDPNHAAPLYSLYLSLSEMARNT